MILTNKLIYFFSAVLLSLGLYIILSSYNYVKKTIGLAVFQNSVLIFYIALAKTKDGITPIDQCFKQLNCSPITYSNPISHVLMLTAIVVGIATMSVGLSLICQIHKSFNSCNENDILLQL
ncbi:NADH-ubiquinone/plastoquinone oxidoreductase chain 4L family protein [Orientia chuto str. Dubai]|uniref:NADH-ubiquinone/plastoquinone oxidoreductase chain 4L family protein n=1 Tax=Orientia chuto str. Dubai TaxID=1359168 RepID=A0A0F3MN49_9RICK|nr:cation:proton antiporter subunit C [Candidatus Orientia mediorientalis]KJV57071.1 NADH-ubiquinone/plastoquinone oxidoreductase chain 4L family protein [Orientia chuto str. Dubai]